jgi:arylsulfatase A-like enzyme
MFALGAVSALAAAELPNFVFIMADDMGWGGECPGKTACLPLLIAHLLPDTSYNNGTAQTPNLDAMAAGEGSIRFNRFYAGAAVCAPTRASGV